VTAAAGRARARPVGYDAVCPASTPATAVNAPASPPAADAVLERADALYHLLLGRGLDPGAAESIRGRIAAGTYDDFQLGLQVDCSSEYLGRLVARAADAHIYFVHRSRQMMVRRLLPPARQIIDLGGANAPLYRLGYAHPFERLVMVDLPPEARHEMYKNIRVTAPAEGAEVVIHWSDMTRLEAFPDASFDLVWSGQSIEHVDLEAGRRMCAEAMRVLKPGGRFCLDTPNRGITSIHTRDWGGGFIHPEHKHEYHGPELRAQLEAAGFEVEQAKGVCEMPETFATGNFHYEDFILGNPLTDDVERGYILYFGCRKPG
jgi:SAM-dependent methyltransferase